MNSVVTVEIWLVFPGILSAPRSLPWSGFVILMQMNRMILPVRISVTCDYALWSDLLSYRALLRCFDTKISDAGLGIIFPYKRFVFLSKNMHALIYTFHRQKRSRHQELIFLSLFITIPFSPRVLKHSSL